MIFAEHAFQIPVLGEADVEFEKRWPKVGDTIFRRLDLKKMIYAAFHAPSLPMMVILAVFGVLITVWIGRN